MSKNKKKTGSIALPYLITIFVGILIIGGGTIFTLRHFGILNNHKQLKQPPQRDISTATYENNHTILFILDEPNTRCKSTFMLMRSIPKDKKLVFVGIPTNTIAIVDGGQQSIKSAYENGGESAAINFTEQLFGIKVDRYMKFNSDSLIKVCDILGGVTYPIPEDISGFNSDGTEQYLNAELIERLITYSLFNDGEVERAYITSSIFAKMINGADCMRIAGNLDNSFNTIVNMTDTSVTSVDYKKDKVAIKYMLENGTAIASYYIMDGEKSGSDFIPNEMFFQNLRDAYFKDAPNAEKED